MVFVGYLTLLAGFSEFNPPPVDLAASPYKYSILDWEMTHLPRKWTHRLRSLLPGGSNPTREERVAQAREFFDLGIQMTTVERQLLFPGTASADAAAVQPQQLLRDIDAIKARRSQLQPSVEETVESELTGILQREGLTSFVGVFPPVDAVFSSSPHVLVLSPRDRIARQRDILLEPGLTGAEKESLEAQIAEAEDLSVYIEDTGGVAVYPSVVTDLFGLHNAVEITSHEWIHHWLFFKPLGRNFWASGEMTSLNETVADLAGKELGDKVLESLTGEVVQRQKATTPPTQPPDPNAFDFRAEMRQTRLHAEELLAAGKIEEAEAYMEERRRLFVEQGYLIRKLNQAYFAFHGTYAASAASVSPIGDQVLKLRDNSDSLKDFLETVAEFGSYQEFVQHVEGLAPVGL